MNKYIMALDQGTTSSRCFIYDQCGNPVSSAQKEITQYFPKAGWVEQDAMEIWSTQMAVASEALHKIGATYKEIESIGITNQRETTVLWDRRTGKPVYNAIVWQCRRTADYCEELKRKGLNSKVKEKTGLFIDSYFSGTKLKWILENVNGVKERAYKGDLLFGTIETWLIWRMTGGEVHITDYSNASRTMMFNINELNWDDEILEILDIPRSVLPDPVQSSMVYGETLNTIFGGPVKISGAAGDQQCALFGQTCFEAGDTKSTYGTGNFLLMNTGSKPVHSNNGLLTTVAWGIGNEVCYALEGSVFICGAAVQWLRDEIGIIRAANETQAACLAVADNEGVYMVPAFVGLGAPYWDSGSRGTIMGMTRGTTKNHIIRAAVESMAYQCADLFALMNEDSRCIESQGLRVDGGACANDFLMQFQADILNKNIIRPQCVETTSLGAAYLAGLAVGYWSSKEDVKENWKVDRVFKPIMSRKKRDRLIREWNRAVKTAMYWSNLHT